MGTEYLNVSINLDLKVPYLTMCKLAIHGMIYIPGRPVTIFQNSCFPYTGSVKSGIYSYDKNNWFVIKELIHIKLN